MNLTWNILVDDGVTRLSPAAGADLTNIRLGTTGTPHLHNGVSCYAIVGRRALEKVWQIDYAEEIDCDEEALCLHTAILGFIAGSPWPIFPTRAVRVVHYDGTTGAIILDEDLPAPKPRPEADAADSYLPPWEK